MEDSVFEDEMQELMVMEAVGSFSMLVHIAQTTWHHVPEESCYENLKSHINFHLWKYYENITI
jgi:hypothetical protein